jgi:heat shock protein HslJ
LSDNSDKNTDEQVDTSALQIRKMKTTNRMVCLNNSMDEMAFMRLMELNSSIDKTQLTNKDMEGTRDL